MAEFIYIYLLGALGGAVIGTLPFLIIYWFEQKKTLLTGPLSSGKTTFLRYLSNEKIPDGPSGVPRSYKIKDAIFDEVTDLSGDESWLTDAFDKYINDHDYLLFFFDVSEYLKDEKYREDCNARIDLIHKTVSSSLMAQKMKIEQKVRKKLMGTKVLMVGTHIDLVSGNYKADIERLLFAGKTYQRVLNRIVYVDTRKKKCVKTIFNALKK